MVFDTLFALDSKVPHRIRMSAIYAISPDTVYRLLPARRARVHDGSRVRGADCVASLSAGWLAPRGHTLATVIERGWARAGISRCG